MAKKSKAAAAPKAAKAAAGNKMKFVGAEKARAAVIKLENDPDWAEDMTHEESTTHLKAINRSC